MSERQGRVVNGWTLLQTPAFAEAYGALIEKVERLQKKHREGVQSMAPAKRLYAINKLILDVIPKNPGSPEYYLGNTIGPEHKHWRRAKFFQQYRLFFRYNEAHRIIIYGWVNSEVTKRAYGSRSDAYLVFQKRLKAGKPPSDWEDLLQEASEL